MSKSSTSRFLTGVLTMAVSQLIIKLAGLVYRLVITNVPGFGDVGNGFYTAGFQIYTLLLSLSSVGIPNAISKLVSAQVALGHRAEAHRIFRTALVLFFGIGLVCSGALFFGADFIALYIIKMDGVQGTLQALSPLYHAGLRFLRHPGVLPGPGQRDRHQPFPSPGTDR